MEILQIVALGLVAALLLVILRQQRPEMALQLSLAAGVAIFLLLISRIQAVLQVLEDLAFRAHINPFYLSAILKVIGIAYIAEFGAQVCRDAQEGAVAAKIEMAGKILIMLVAVPIIAAIVEMIFKLLP